MSTVSDRNLLLGILAVQMDFVSRDQLLAAMNAWVIDKQRALDAILLEAGALRPDTRELLLALVEKHLELHAGDSEQSLAAFGSIGTLREDLSKLGDDQLDATLAVVSQDCETNDPHATLAQTDDFRETNVQRYRILRPHARGGLGEVSVAHDGELNREVALKEIQERYADDPNSRGRFIVEAEVTGGLEHPGIVPVYGLGKYADGRPYYAMRFIRGDSLQEAVDRFRNATVDQHHDGPIEVRKLLGRFVDVCQAIEYAHSRGVLHRDLKPGNIMLGAYGETLVVDWGLAKVVGRDDAVVSGTEPTFKPSSDTGSAPTQMGSAIGTPAYMSPEQAAGRLDDLGPASDVYSLGATLYYILTGQAPVQGSDRGATLRKVQAGDFPRPSDVHRPTPQPLEAICLKAMALQPGQRYASPRDLAEDVERFLADEPVEAHVEPWSIRTQRWLRKHPKSVAAMAGAVLVGLASLVVIASLVSVANEKERQAATQAKADALRLAQANAALRSANIAERQAKQEAEASRLEAVRSLVTALQFAPPAQVPASIDGLRAFREQAMPLLREQFASAEGAGKLQTAFALAAFGEGPHEYLVEHLSRAPENQAPNLLASLDMDAAKNRARLASAFHALDGEAVAQRARLAAAALCLGNAQPAAAALIAAPDPMGRATLIHEFRHWHDGLSLLPAVVESAEQADFRSGICLCLGRTPVETIAPAVRTELVALLHSWHASAGHPGVHNAAGWALQQWGESSSSGGSNSAPQDDRHWHRNSLGMTMLRIPKGTFARADGGRAAELKRPTRVKPKATQKVAITKDFLLSSTEVRLKDWWQFVDDTSYTLETAPGVNAVPQRGNAGGQPKEPEPRQSSQLNDAGAAQGNVRNQSGKSPAEANYPAYDLSWVDAVAFCNWLSQREKLAPAYFRDEDGQWRRNRVSAGYRLPTEAEWEFACRAGATTVYTCGDDTDYLSDYAVYRTDFLQPVGTKMPNPWGLFDMHGNVAEWCDDVFAAYGAEPVSDPMGPTDGTTRVLRGGTHIDSAGILCAGARRHATHDQRVSRAGFRVARGLP